MNNKDYHGILIKQSQRNKFIFKQMNIIGKKKVFFGFVVLYKISASPEKLDDLIQSIQENMAKRMLFAFQEFYAHFYRDSELIVVFRDKVFHMTTEKSSWEDAIAYGKSLGIIEKQLDFTPNRIEDETY